MSIRTFLLEITLILCMTVVPYAAFVYAVRAGHFDTLGIHFFPVSPADDLSGHSIYGRGMK